MSEGDGKLTTHVLDTAHGCPGRGIILRLFRCAAQGNNDHLLLETATNADGRCDQPLLAGDKMEKGDYRLEFSVGAYFKAKGVKLSDPPFLDIIPIRFAIADTDIHYHVPLLVSPYGYSTYRGS